MLRRGMYHIAFLRAGFLTLVVSSFTSSSDCPPGYFWNYEDCEECPPGTYREADFPQNNCYPHVNCSALYNRDILHPGTGSKNNECGDCRAGYTDPESGDSTEPKSFRSICSPEVNTPDVTTQYPQQYPTGQNGNGTIIALLAVCITISIASLVVAAVAIWFSWKRNTSKSVIMQDTNPTVQNQTNEEMKPLARSNSQTSM